MSSLLDPIAVGGKLLLRNRVVMGSMTRNRCVDNLKPGPAQVKHYADRARYGTGLIINEGTFIDWSGSNYDYAPVIINDDHAEAWRKVVDAVHEQGGKILLQAWHAGRCQNEQMPIMKEKGCPVLAPSAIKAEGGKYRQLPGTPGYTENITVIEDPGEVVLMYKRAAQLAQKAGFDGIELLAQGGYLPHQFLSSRANTRADKYGGSVANRCRFILEVVDAFSTVFGGYGLICVKLCPTDFLNDSVVTYEEMQETYQYLIPQLVDRKVGIINLTRRGAEVGGDYGNESGNTTGLSSRPDAYPLPPGYDPVLDFGPLVKYHGSSTLLMGGHGYTVEEADQLIHEGKLDLVSFARPFIYNPDVVTRIEHGVAFADNDRGQAVYYGPFDIPDENYNDWPAAGL